MFRNEKVMGNDKHKERHYNKDGLHDGIIEDIIWQYVMKLGEIIQYERRDVGRKVRWSTCLSLFSVGKLHESCIRLVVEDFNSQHVTIYPCYIIHIGHMISTSRQLCKVCASRSWVMLHTILYVSTLQEALWHQYIEYRLHYMSWTT